jgi:hypothetical protein
VRLLIPHGRRVRAAGWVRPHRTRRLGSCPQCVDGLPVVPVPRAAVDAARLCRSEDQMRAAFTESVEGGHCTLDDLFAELAAGPRQHTAPVGRMLRELAVTLRPPAGPGAADAEAEARTLFAGSAILPPLLWSPTLRSEGGRPLPSPDGWIAEVDLGIEIAPADSPRQRHVELARHGARLLRLTPVQLRTDPGEVRRAVEWAYLDRLRSGIRGTVTAHASG